MFRTLTRPSWSTPAVTIAALVAATASFFVARQVSARRFESSRTSQVGAHAYVSSRPESAKLSGADWDTAWDKALEKAASPARTRRLEALIEQLARTDPQRALQLAKAENNWLTRDQLRNAALRGWGAVAPDAAADWAMGREALGERMYCVQAVLSGAVEKPEDAVRVGLKVCAADPLPAGDYGHALINALIDKAGSYEAATKFALAATMVDRQSYLLDSAFYQWAQHQPDLALTDFSKISDPKVRASAMKGVIEGWADADANKLAEFAQTMPEGEERSRFMGIALTQWVNKSPEAALQWMNQFDPHPDFDRGFATLALTPSLLEAKPESAIEMTEFITDQAQRTLTRDNAFWRWALRDPEGARNYAESVQNPEYRQSMLDDLTRLPKEP